MRLLAAVLLGLVLVAGIAPAASANSSRAWSRDVVYVEDHLGSLWPLHTAAERLDNHSALDLRVVKKCPRGSQCVKARQTERIAGRPIGYGGIGFGILVENAWGRHQSYARRLNLVEHELGHAVGLLHGPCDNSIMCKHSQTRTYPTTRDYRLLRKMYG